MIEIHHFGTRYASVVVLATALVGCSTTATIKTTDGYQVERTIQGADESHLFLAADGPGDPTIERTQVWDIDHPGNVLAIVGASIGVSNTITYAFTLTEPCDPTVEFCSSTEESTKPAVAMIIQTLSASGFGALLGYGLHTWLDSKRRAGDDTRPLVMAYGIAGGALAVAGTAGLVYGTLDGGPELGTAGMTAAMLGIGGLALGGATLLGALLASGDAPAVGVVPVAGDEMTGAMATFAW